MAVGAILGTAIAPPAALAAEQPTAAAASTTAAGADTGTADAVAAIRAQFRDAFTAGVAPPDDGGPAPVICDV